MALSPRPALQHVACRSKIAVFSAVERRGCPRRGGPGVHGVDTSRRELRAVERERAASEQHIVVISFLARARPAPVLLLDLDLPDRLDGVPARAAELRAVGSELPQLVNRVDSSA